MSSARRSGSRVGVGGGTIDECDDQRPEAASVEEVDNDGDEEMPPAPTAAAGPSSASARRPSAAAAAEAAEDDEDDDVKLARENGDDGGEDASVADDDEKSVSSRTRGAASHISAASSPRAAAAATVVASPRGVAPLYQFADLSTSESRFVVMLTNCPMHDVLRKLVRIVARPESHAHELIRDPLNAAPLFQSNSANAVSGRNVRICTDFLRGLSKLAFCSSFLIKLSNSQLLSYETTLRQYLVRTGGVPPIDLTSMIQKLQNSRPDYEPVRDEEGFADAYPNSVSAVIIDIVNCVLNAVKFNPPNHMVHLQALEFADKLYRTHLPSLRKTLKLSSDLEVCLICGGATSDERDPLGLLMQCESCGCWHHQGCADVQQVPKEAFYCAPCLIMNPKLARGADKRAKVMGGFLPLQPPRGPAHSPMRTKSASPATVSGDAHTQKRRERADTPSADSTGAKRQKVDAPAAATSGPSEILYTNQNVRRPLSRPSSPQPEFPDLAAAPATGSTSEPPPPPPPPPRSGRTSPDGAWVRLLDFKVRDRIHRKTHPASASSAIGQDEPELRALRCDLDQAMRVIAASSERMAELQQRQRTRAARQQAREADAKAVEAACKHAVQMMAEPVETHLDTVRNEVRKQTGGTTVEHAPSPSGSDPAPAAATTAAAAASAAATPPTAEATATERLLCKYRQRHEATTHVLHSLTKRLSTAQSVAAHAQERLELLESRSGFGEEQHSRQLLAMESSLSQARRQLLEERNSHIDAINQINSHQRLIIHIVERLNQGAGQRIPVGFGTNLLAETKMMIRDQQKRGAQPSAPATRHERDGRAPSQGNGSMRSAQPQLPAPRSATNVQSTRPAPSGALSSTTSAAATSAASSVPVGPSHSAPPPSSSPVAPPPLRPASTDLSASLGSALGSVYQRILQQSPPLTGVNGSTTSGSSSSSFNWSNMSTMSNWSDPLLSSMWKPFLTPPMTQAAGVTGTKTTQQPAPFMPMMFNLPPFTTTPTSTSLLSMLPMPLLPTTTAPTTSATSSAMMTNIKPAADNQLKMGPVSTTPSQSTTAPTSVASSGTTFSSFQVPQLPLLTQPPAAVTLDLTPDSPDSPLDLPPLIPPTA